MCYFLPSREKKKWLVLRILRKHHCFDESVTENDKTNLFAVKKKEYVIKKYSPIISVDTKGTEIYKVKNENPISEL